MSSQLQESINDPNPDYGQAQPADQPQVIKSSISTTESIKNSQETSQNRASVQNVVQPNMNHLRQSQNSSKAKSSMQKRSPYLVINTRENTDAQKDRIAQQHDELFEKNEKGEIRRVKFESPGLKYTPKELFFNRPTFHEPFINFESVTSDQINKIENIEGPKKELTEREKLAMNNYAVTNQDLVASESPSNWKIMHEMLTSNNFNLTKQMQHKHYEDLRSPAMPFMSFPKEELKNKIKRAKEYKKSAHFKESGGYFLDYSAYEQKAKKMGKEDKKRGSKLQSKQGKNSPRSSFNSAKKQQNNRQNEVLSRDSSDCSHEDKPRAKSSLNIGSQLPQYYKSHIQKEKTNHSAIRMQKMLQAMNIDPQDLGKPNRGKSQEQKNREIQRIQQRMDKKLERFNERNLVSTARRVETEVDYNITARGTVISNPVTQRTTDRNLTGMSTLQTERGHICMTGSINGAFYCQKHPQQLVNYHYVRLLQEHEENQRRKARGVTLGKPEVKSPKSQSDSVTPIEAKYAKPKQKHMRAPVDTAQSTNRQKSVKQKAEEVPQVQGLKGKSLRLDKLRNTEDSMFSEGRQDVSDGPATFRNNSVEQWTGRISPTNQQKSDLQNSRNFNFVGGLSTGFANGDLSKQNIEIINNPGVNQQILDHLQNESDSIENDEDQTVKIQDQYVKDSQEVVLQKSPKNQDQSQNQGQDYADANEQQPAFKNILQNKNSRSQSKQSQRIIRRRQSELSEQMRDHEGVDMQIQLTSAPINPSDLRLQEHKKNGDSIQKKQEVLFAGKNPFGEFSETIDLLQRESQSKQVEEYTWPSPGLSRNPSSNLEKLIGESNSKVLVQNLLNRGNSTSNHQDGNAKKKMSKILSGGTSTNDENSYIQIQEGEFLFTSNNQKSSALENLNHKRQISQPVSGLSGYDRMIKNINKTSTGIHNSRPGTQQNNTPNYNIRPGTQQFQASYMDKRAKLYMGLNQNQEVSNLGSTTNNSPKNKKLKREWDNRVTTAPTRAFSLQKIRRNVHTRAKIQAIENPNNGQFSTIYVGSGIPMTIGSNEELNSRNQNQPKQYFSQTIENEQNPPNVLQNDLNFNVLSERSKDQLVENTFTSNLNRSEVTAKVNRKIMKNAKTGDKLPSLFEVKGKSKTLKPLLVKIDNSNMHHSRRISFVMDEDDILSNQPSQRPKTVMNETTARTPKRNSQRNIIDENKLRFKTGSASKSPPKKKETMSNFVKQFEHSKRISEIEEKLPFDRQATGTIASMLSDYSTLISTQKTFIKSHRRTLSQITDQKFTIKPKKVRDIPQLKNTPQMT